MARLTDGESVEIKGSSGSKYILRRQGSIYSCSCPAWMHARGPENTRTCKHLKEYLGDEEEQNRTTKAAGKHDPVQPKKEGVWREDLLNKAERMIDRGQNSEAWELLRRVYRDLNRFEAAFAYGRQPQMEKDLKRYMELSQRLRQEKPSDTLRRASDLFDPQPDRRGQTSDKPPPASNVVQMRRAGDQAKPPESDSPGGVSPTPAAQANKPARPCRVLPTDVDEFYNEVVRDTKLREYDLFAILRGEMDAGVTWPWSQNTKTAIVRLAKERILNRDQLLDLCVDKMMTERRELLIRWFSDLHDAIEPDEEERHLRLDKYIKVLNVPDTEKVIFAVRQLQKLAEQNRVDVVAVSEHFPMILKAPDYDSRVVPPHVISLLKALSQHGKESARETSKLAALMLQSRLLAQDAKKFLDIVTKYGDKHDAELVLSLRKAFENLSGANMSRLTEWLEDSSVPFAEPDRAKTESEQAAAKLVAQDIQKLQARIEKIDGDLTEFAGVGEALSAVQGEISAVSALNLRSRAIPRLNPADAIVPIKSIESLVSAFVHIIGRKVSGTEIERVLDGLSRICNQQPPDFKLRVAQLRARAIDRLQPVQTQDEGLRVTQPFMGVNHQEDLAALALAWTEGTNIGELSRISPRLDDLFGDSHAERSGFNKGKLALLSFFSGRIYHLALRVAKRIAAPLLSAPTHRGGWIDPRVVPGRLRQLALMGVEPDEFDVVQMLLRLAPDHAEEAVSLAEDLVGEEAAAFRYALSGPPPMSMSKRSYWASAARARAPLGDDDLVAQRFKYLPTDTAYAAQYGTNADQLIGLSDSATWTVIGNFLLPRDFSVTAGSVIFPTTLFHTKPYTFAALQLINKPEWEPLIWPQCRESYFAGEARTTLQYINSQGTYWQSEWKPLFEVDTNASGLAPWLIVFGLSARHQNCAQQAQEGLIACIEDGRLDGDSLGAVLEQVLPTGKLTGSRLTAAFEQAVQVSPLHAQVIKRAMERGLGHMRGCTHKPPPKWLDLLYRASSQIGESIKYDRARAYLEWIGYSKIAKAILRIEDVPQSRAKTAAALYALERRVARAERWQHWRRAKSPTPEIAAAPDVQMDS